MPETPTVALIGSDSLLAREVRDLVSTTGRDLSLRLVASIAEEPGKLTLVGDEASVVTGLTAVSLAGARAVILAGNAASSEKALKLLGDPPEAAVVDLTYTAEDLPDARLRAPLVESAAGQDAGEAAVHVIAHPAAIAIALLLRRLHANDPIRNSVIQIFAPASEHGAPGVQELQQQTVSLLSFKSVPKALFDAQLGFNLLPRYGEEARVPLEETELRIERHLATLLALPGDGEGAAISNRPPTSDKPGREASRWARSCRTATIRTPYGSGSSPTTSAWRPKTRLRWRGKWYEIGSDYLDVSSTQRRRERRGSAEKTNQGWCLVFSAFVSAISASLR